MALRIDFDGVEGIITSMSKQIDALQETAREIDNLIMNDLGAHWEGDSYNSCIETYSEDYQKLLTNDIPETVSKLNEFMQTCKDKLRETDQALSGK